MREELQRYYVEAIILLIIGFFLILLSNSISIPSEYNTFLGIPYQYNPNYAVAFLEKIFTIILGIAFILGCLGTLTVASYRASKFEKEVKPQIPPPPPELFCRYCGTQNASDSVFCSKCGKKLT